MGITKLLRVEAHFVQLSPEMVVIQQGVYNRVPLTLSIESDSLLDVNEDVGDVCDILEG